MLNRDFIKQQGRVRLVAAERATVTVLDGSGPHYQVCQIAFQKSDGSILVQCPYFPGRNGILSSPPHDAAKGPPYSYTLSDHGKLTSHLVKLSHHPDGKVHFSQDGRIVTTIGRNSVNLRTSIGNIFQLSIYHPHGFQSLKKPKAGRAYLPFPYTDRLPEAITVWAEWRRRSDLEANTDPPGSVTGPNPKIKNRVTGYEGTVFFLGQPFGHPIRSHVLVVGVDPTLLPEGVNEPMMVLLAGFDPHEMKTGDPQPKQTGLLMWWYPFMSSEEGRKRIGSVDFNPEPRF